MPGEVFNGCRRVGRKPVRMRNRFARGALYQSDPENQTAMYVGGHELLPGQAITLIGDVSAVSTADDQLLRWLGQEDESHGNR